MEFVSMRDRQVNSILGHCVGFKKGVPQHVPPALYDEVMAAGAVPVHREKACPVSNGYAPLPVWFLFPA